MSHMPKKTDEAVAECAANACSYRLIWSFREANVLDRVLRQKNWRIRLDYQVKRVLSRRCAANTNVIHMTRDRITADLEKIEETLNWV